jgi:ferrous iron transport protein B
MTSHPTTIRERFEAPKPGASRERVILVGSPNVGKSAMFNRLTGRYVTVSNYPGTTVEVARGQSTCFGRPLEVIDTPGMYSLSPVTEEERVARDVLFDLKPKAVLHVIDAKNISRMLGLTLQLVGAGLPVVLVLNMADEADELGVKIDARRLEKVLGVPVVATVATSGRGLQELAERVAGLNGSPGPAGRPGQEGEAGAAPGEQIEFGDVLGPALAEIASELPARKGLSPRARAMLLLQEDAEERRRLIEEKGPQGAEAVLRLVSRLGGDGLGHSPHYHFALAMKALVDDLLLGAVALPPLRRTGFREKLSQFTMSPWTGLPLLVAVLYFGLYQFVGRLGAGVCVDFLEHSLFCQYVNPWVEGLAHRLLPWTTPDLAGLFAGDYGIITLGLRYAVAIILPVVGTFFIAFSILEDSGYLPRLAMLIDRLLKRIGLNGRAVIPLVLGFGCATMATMVTRTLETRRERLIATILLALAIPCSAQMGLILALLAGKPLALLVWGGVVAGIFLLVGAVAARVLPGERPSFYMELPPLRLPRLGNVAVKTYTRLAWYFKEILPMFIVASVLIWLGRLDFGGLLPQGGLFKMITGGLEPVMRSLGLPNEASVSFLFGFFRRDYGAAGLYDLQRHGTISGNQIAVAAITLTLFLPCIAQFLIMWKERGWKVTFLTSAFVCAVAYSAGLATHTILGLLRVEL